MGEVRVGRLVQLRLPFADAARPGKPHGPGARSEDRRRDPSRGQADAEGYAILALGGGTGTFAERASALSDGTSGHSGAARTGTKGATRSRMSTIFSRLGASTAGARPPHVSRALLSARQIAHGRPGSNVSLAAAEKDSVLA